MIEIKAMKSKLREQYTGYIWEDIFEIVEMLSRGLSDKEILKNLKCSSLILKMRFLENAADEMETFLVRKNQLKESGLSDKQVFKILKSEFA